MNHLRHTHIKSTPPTVFVLVTSQEFKNNQITTQGQHLHTVPALRSMSFPSGNPMYNEHKSWESLLFSYLWHYLLSTEKVVSTVEVWTIKGGKCSRESNLVATKTKVLDEIIFNHNLCQSSGIQYSLPTPLWSHLAVFNPFVLDSIFCLCCKLNK